MTIAEIALEGFLYLLGGLVASFVVAEAIHLYNEKQRNESFTTAVDVMSKSTVVAVESIKDTTVTAINSLLDMSALHDVNSLAREKAKENNANTTTANK
jgi:ACR3 family arsenite efflux pump ArsB